MRIAEPKDHEPIRLVQTKSGPRYRVTLDTARKGEKRRQVTSTHRTLREAREHVLNVRSELARGTYAAPTSETLAQLSERWLATSADVRAVTLEGYRGVLARILSRLGDRGVQSIRVGDLDELFGWLAAHGSKSGGPLKPRTVQLGRTVLGMIFDQAVREGTIPTNPARLARRPRVRTVAGTDLRHWTLDQLGAFVTAADSDPWAALWRLTACGLTRADVMGLRWSDLDLDQGVLVIAQGRVALASGRAVTDDPKSNARRRAIPYEVLRPGTTARLRILRARQAADQMAAGEAWNDTGYVLVDAIGQPVRPEVYSDRFRRIVKAADLPPITLHEVRHSVAIGAHSLGVTPRDAAGLLGHSLPVHMGAYLLATDSAGIATAAAALGRSVTG